MKRLVKLYAKRGVTVELFAEYDEAFDWLRHQGVVPIAKAT